MKRGTLIFTGAALSLVLGAAAFGFSIVGERPAISSPHKTLKLATVERTLDGACSSATTYERLKARLFDVALDVGDVDPAKLDLLAGSTVVRMEDPILKAKDEELGVTVCTGRFVVELPPGAEKAFDGRRRLEAEIEYAAQVAADGSGIVYQLRGAEPITYRLAAFDLQGLPPLAPVKAASRHAEAEPILMPAEAVPAAVVSMPAEAPKPVPAVPVLAEKAAEPVKGAKPAAAKVKAEPAPAVRPKPVKVAAKAQPAETSVAKKKAKPTIKVAEKAAKPKSKPEKAKVMAAAAKPKPSKPVKVAAAKPVVKVAAVKSKAVEVKKRKAVVKVAAVAPEPGLKPAAKAAKPVVPAKPAPVRKAAQPVGTASRNLPCGAGRPLSERLICANPSLAARERRMMGVYYSALDNADGSTRRLLQETAGDFQAYRNNCRTESCLAGAFDDRVAEIRDILADMR